MLITRPLTDAALGTRLPVVNVEMKLGDVSVGGFVKYDNPPVLLHRTKDPFFAESEINVWPYPPRAGEPTELCVDLYNVSDLPQAVVVNFNRANFGIGLPWYPVNEPIEIMIPPRSHERVCTVWVPETGGHFCVQVELNILGETPYLAQFSQRNLDVAEPLVPGEPHQLVFQVGNFPQFSNPQPETTDIWLEHDLFLPGWEVVLDPMLLTGVAPGTSRQVVMTVNPPAGVPLPPDGAPIVDVRAMIDTMDGEHVIGGFRKIYRPPVILHRYPDPIYAEREITVHPYPPMAGEPTEVCVELYNPTAMPVDVDVQFLWANFGIGIPFSPINGLRPVHLPPFSKVVECIHWVPPVSGHVCLEVELYIDKELSQRSQRNIDVNEPLEPLTHHSMVFPVGNPFDHPVDIHLGAIPHLDGWEIQLEPPELLNVPAGETKKVTLTVRPPEDLPPDGHPIVDIEAYAEGQLIGGFRKIYRPPVPIHRPKDPIYAESEIGIDPYPALAGVETELSVEVFNPTQNDETIEVTFSIARFGIGLPFNSAGITPNPINIFVPANGAARGHVLWIPPWPGKYCVQVDLKLGDYEVIWSQRNIDVGEPLKPGLSHKLVFPVGNPTKEIATIKLGLIKHRDDILASLSDVVLPDVGPGDSVSVTLTVSPTLGAELGTGEPIVDVEAFIDGELIGGFRKLDVPPINIHKPHEKVYAESDIFIVPEPPMYGEEATLGTIVQNDGDAPIKVDLEFGWAQFGMGIPFTHTGIVPFTRTVTVDAGMTETASVKWTPSVWGSQCVIIKLQDRDGIYEPQESQRNVHVEEQPPCGVKRFFSFSVYNDSPFTVTVDLGMVTFNVPADWSVTTVPNGSVDLGPFNELVVEVIVEIPCPPTVQALSEVLDIQRIQAEAGSIPTINVEGYVVGELIGGIEIRLPVDYTQPWFVIRMPIVGEGFK
jgi:hypothetical protein